MSESSISPAVYAGAPPHLATLFDEMVIGGLARYIETSGGELLLRLDTGETFQFVEGGLKRIA